VQVTSKRWGWFVIGIAALVAVAGAACADPDADKSPTAAATSAATKAATVPAATAAATKPAATVAATSAATAAATSAATSAATAGGGDATTLALIAKNTLWDKSELNAKPGAVTITVDNQDDGIPHNLHVYKGKDAKGQDMGMTELEAGPVKQELKLTLDKGDHFFVCDVHPATMAGKLEVE
jgi:plastocyanin